ncbi:TetR family transcriptional regulator [Frankia sp. ACN1ag]|uniref:TetR family transcriptional regulator n=1 Tax=Frankia sp. ACN1ag TaxID=102891 RepID=UPI0006DC89C7|nr:TetR family transcriptional regulator [Frankia sp. ACN1ag]KQC35962.1 TetR family transcriptional regulator [Frankia sp. ACN1ag]
MPPTANTNAKRSRSRRARGSINAAGILSGAFEFCRDTPVDQLSMPRLAAFLDVGVTSIYWYYKNKRDLLDAMTEEALAAFYESMPPLRAGGWEDMLRGFFDDCYTALAADDLTCDLIARRIGGATRQAAVTTWPRAAELLDGLREAGFPPSLAWHAFVTLAAYTRGFLLTEQPTEAPPGSGRRPAVAAAAAAPTPATPATQVTATPATAAVTQTAALASELEPSRPIAGPPEEFAFGITNIILGLRSLLPQEAHDREVA